MAVAMKDLEIRGAGNLLGGEQSGHIADVGFDLYVRLVGEAVAEYREGGSTEPEHLESKVELPIDAHLPHEYIAEERLRLEAYRLLASAHSDEELDSAVEELTDRYGSPPAAVENLVAVARLRVVAARAGLGEVVAAGNYVRLAPVELAESRSLRLTRLYPGSVIKPAVRTILVPRPTTARVGGVPLKDMDLMVWTQDLIESVLLD